MSIGPGMKQLCEKLELVGFSLAEAHAVEVFARQGDWHTRDYYQQVASLEAWEIDNSHFSNLRKNLPGVEIKHVDSIQHIRLPQNAGSADLVVVDNPQGTFGPDNEYCEHFDVIDPALDLLRAGGVVVFNVNIEPFDYDLYPEWQARREQFYVSNQTEKLSLDVLGEFYRERFEALGHVMTDHVQALRTDYLHYMAYRVA